MSKFRKISSKEIEVEAELFTLKNKDRCLNFTSSNRYPDFVNGVPVLRIQTLEGEETAYLGDWIVKYSNGQCYPHSQYIFERAFESIS